MKIKNIIYIGIVCFLFSLGASAATHDLLRERVYVQSDKQSYLAGELLWFKLITTSEDGVPLSFSKVAYLEILDGETSHLQSKVEIQNGIASGAIIIPTTLSSGNYTLVAYTRQMRNEKPIPYFKKQIAIINTLIDEPYSPTNQDNRKIYVESIVNPSKDIMVETDKTTYTKRAKVEVKLEGLPEDLKTLSISVTGDEFYGGTGNINILNWLNNNLDGIKNTRLENQYTPEYEGHIIKAQLIDGSTRKPTSKNDINAFVAFVGDEFKLYSGKPNDKGEIYFYTDNPLGKKEIALAIENDEEGLYKLDIESPFIKEHDIKNLEPLNLIEIDKDILYKRNIGLQVMYAYTEDSLDTFTIPKPYYYRDSDNRYIMAEYVKFPTMQDVITEFVSRVRFKTYSDKHQVTMFRNNIGYTDENILAIVDGIPIFNHEIIYKYNPIYIENIDVYFDKFVIANNKFDGIFSFTTKNNSMAGLELDKSTSVYKYESPQRNRIFYHPTHNENKAIPDYRHTLYWNPDVKFDKDLATTSFYTSDIEGSYRITVEGLTDSGESVFKILEIKVK